MFETLCGQLKHALAVSGTKAQKLLYLNIVINDLFYSIPCTCIFLWPHWPIDDPLEGRYPIPLLGLCLTGKQELPVRRDDGDAVVPAAALRRRGQAGQDGVAVLLTADEHLATGISILGEEGTQGE